MLDFLLGSPGLKTVCWSGSWQEKAGICKWGHLPKYRVKENWAGMEQGPGISNVGEQVPLLA